MPDLMARFNNAQELTEYFDGNFQRFLWSRLWRNPELLACRLACLLTRRGKFKDNAAARSFREKSGRIDDAVALKKPDRVPVITNGMSFYPAHYSGVSFADFCNDRKKCENAFLKFARENTDFDAIFPAPVVNRGPAIKLTELDILKLPGVHLPDNVCYQFIEKERLRPDEYQDLLDGGFDFFKRTILPRMTPLYDPDNGWGKRLFLKLIVDSLSYQLLINRTIETLEKEYGTPAFTGGFSVAPYDFCSILFRGLVGISKDLFERPEMVEAAVDMMMAPAARVLETTSLASGLKACVIMIERGFSLSPRQFARFYMPSLKRLTERMIEMGLIPCLALEENCDHLIDQMLELPPQKCVLLIDTSDIFKAKKILGGHMCIVGNVPMATLAAGTPADVKEYCKRLLEEVAPDGGFIMSGALGIPDNAKPENVRAMVEYTIENGRY